MTFWIIVPKTLEGSENIKQLIKKILEKVSAPPLNEEEWGS